MGGNFTPCWFSLNNSETVKAVTLAFWNIQKYIIRDIHATFGIPNSSQFPYTGRNSDRGISDFWMSGQCFVKENCYNSRISSNIDMKLEQVTLLDKRNMATLRKLDNDMMSINRDVIVIFLIYGQFGAIWKLVSRHMICKSDIFINSSSFFLQYMNIELKDLQHSSHTIAFRKGTISYKKYWFFAKD